MKRIDIHVFTEEHARNLAYLKWLNNEEVTQYLGRDDMTSVTVEDTLKYFYSLKKNALAHFYALYDKESETFIGTCKIMVLAASGIKEGICDIGIMIGDKSFWGKGYGSEAINIMSSFCFNELYLRKITAGCYANNVAMVKAFEKNGYKIEGRLRKQLKYNEQYVDHILFGCFPEDLIISRNY